MMLTNTTKLPLNIQNNLNLTDEQISMLGRLEQYDLSFVTDRLVNLKLIKSDQIDRAIIEFKKYMALLALGYGKDGIAMMSSEVDEVWHNFLLFTRQYGEFCEGMIGRMIHHIPCACGDQPPVQMKINFVESYNKVYGEIPTIWNDNVDQDSSCSCGQA